MQCSYVHIRKIVYVYMFLPLWSFIALYLHSISGGIFLVSLLLISIMNTGIKKKMQKMAQLNSSKISPETIMQIGKKYLLIFALVAVAWSFLGGQGNFYYQSPDWGCRNAIYRDIIYREWPVIYPDYNKALVYYIGYWLPSAAIVKIIGFIIPDIYLSEMAFEIGNILLWIWTSIGIFLVELLLFTYVKPKKCHRVLLIPTIMVLFSGMDIIGVMQSIIVEGNQFSFIHLEWWSDNLQFSSLTTCLFWVFNQTIIPWLAILCILQEKKLHNYIFIILCAFATGPIPAVGIGVYMFLNGIYKGVESIVNKRIREFLREAFSLVNCLAILVLPVFIIYYKSNQALNNSVVDATSVLFSVFKLTKITDNFIKKVIWFLFLEAGVYLLLIYKSYKNDIFYYITVITIFIAPFIKIGGASDFVMRFSIPTIMVMAAMSIKYVINYDNDKVMSKADKYIFTILCICLLIGAMTPMTEFFRGYSMTLQTGRIANVCDDIKTLNQDIVSDNFTAFDYRNNMFFRIFMRNK